MDLKQAEIFERKMENPQPRTDEGGEKKSGELRKIGEVSIKTGKYGPTLQFNGKNYNILINLRSNDLNSRNRYKI